MIQRNEIAKIIAKWCVANGEEFLPNPLADKIMEYIKADARADHLAALRRVREKVDKAHVYSDTEDADGVFDMLGKNEILAIIDEEIKEAEK